MSAILLIEDQQETIDDFRAHVRSFDASLRLVAPKDVGLDQWKAVPDTGQSAEEQLANALKAIVDHHALDLVVLDSDLSREDKLQTHSSYRAAFAAIGMPVCRYQKRGSRVLLARLPQLQRTIKDGSSAIWIPGDFVGGDRVAELPRWLTAVVSGFSAIQSALDADEALVDPRHSPIDVLSAVVGRPESASEFLGYAAQNFTFFGNQADADQVQALPTSRVYATRLGYWLFNYVIAFPGPILTAPAACAFLNLDPVMADVPAVAKVLDAARYRGPFYEIEDYYWRSDLARLVDDCQGDIASHSILAGIKLVRVDPERPADPGYICMLSGETIRADQAAATPDWVPPGASEARFKEEVLDQLGPLAGI